LIAAAAAKFKRFRRGEGSRTYSHSVRFRQAAAETQARKGGLTIHSSWLLRIGTM